MGARPLATIGASPSGKVAAGLSLTEAVDVLENVGSIEAEVRQQAYELARHARCDLDEVTEVTKAWEV